MKKVFGIAAMLLALAACNKIETEIQTTDQAEGITITAQLAPKTGGATTRAVSEGGGGIVSDWAETEHLAVLYEVGGTKYAADATITAVDYDDLSATIEFTVEAGTPNNTPCTLVYPYTAAKDDHTGVKDAATLLADQDGTLNANLDVRVGAGIIRTTTPGLTVNTQPEAQFAIFKFTTKNAAGTATINVKPLTITIGSQDYVITPASATSELFAALPPISGEAVTFAATGSDSKTYTASKASVTFSAGKYYQSNIKMAPAPITVTINQSDWGEEADNTIFTKDGVTVSAGSIDAIDGNLMGGGTFSTTLGNFTKIEVTTGVWDASGTGWSGSTWTGNASSVSFSGNIMAMGMTQTTIVCTIVPTN